MAVLLAPSLLHSDFQPVDPTTGATLSLSTLRDRLMMDQVGPVISLRSPCDLPAISLLSPGDLPAISRARP